MKNWRPLCPGHLASKRIAKFQTPMLIQIHILNNSRPWVWGLLSFGGDGELLSAYSFSSSRSSFRKAHVECSIPCWSARWPCTPESPPPVGFDGIHPGFLARHPFKSPFAPISRIAVGQLFEIWEFYLILEGGWVGGWLLSGYEKKVCSRQGE